jgi:hypothetical protein
MCEFVSWIEHKNKIYFLSDRELKTREGKELVKYCGDPTDLLGHGAIRRYFGFDAKVGTDRECTDFSSSDKFPPEIQDMIREGDFKLLPVIPVGLFMTSARAEYNKIMDPAWAEYNKIVDFTRAEYNKIMKSTFWNLYKNPNNRIETWR